MAEFSGRYESEAELASRLSTLSSTHRQAARDAMGDPPDPKRLGEGFWLQVQKELENELAAVLLLVFAGSAFAHRLSQSQSDALSRAAQDFAIRQGIRASSQIVQTSRDRFTTLADRYAELERRTGSPPPEHLVQGDLVTVFGPDRAAGIAITEVTAAQSAGSEWATRVGGLQSEHDIWFTEMDGRVCEICAPLHSLSRSEWQFRQPSGPPAHPRCRCWIQYDFERVGASS